MSRFLFVFDIGFDRNGPSVHLLQEILRAALERGHWVEVILKDTGGPNEEMPAEFRENERFCYHVLPAKDEKGRGFISRYLDEVLYAGSCGRVAGKAGRFDAVFLQSCTTAIFYMAALRKLRCPILFNVQDIFPYNLKLSGQMPACAVTFPVFRLLQHLAYRRAGGIITISQDMKDTLIGDGVDPEKIGVVYNWSYGDSPISLESIPRDRVCDLSLDRSKTNVIYAGNIGRMQNVELIAETASLMAEDPGFHFYVIGGGANRERIEQMTEGLRNLTMLPMQPAEFAESIYAQADVNLIPLAPGVVRTALPSKTATVLRTDRPVIFCVDRSSKLSSLLEGDGQASVADCRSPSDLARAIRESAAGSTEAGGNYRLFCRYFKKSNAGKYIDAMEELAGARKAAGL